MIFRQGDIYLIKVAAEQVPARFETREPSDCILGYGEATGHTHVLEKAQWLVDACLHISQLKRFAEKGESRRLFL